MSRLRRLALSDRYFFITCNLLQTRSRLGQEDFEILARVMLMRREERGFLLTAWVFLPDHWHIILGIRYPQTISLVLEAIKVSSTRQMNTRHKESGRLWQGRFFDRALRAVKEYNETIGYIHWNPVRRGLVKRPGEWAWSSYQDYAASEEELRRQSILRIDRVRLPANERARI
ncbi:MAG: REP-associated tyrosine transposase [Terriglobia bacterium]